MANAPELSNQPSQVPQSFWLQIKWGTNALLYKSLWNGRSSKTYKSVHVPAGRNTC
jgi:hypothetical protein